MRKTMKKTKWAADLEEGEAEACGKTPGHLGAVHLWGKQLHQESPISLRGTGPSQPVDVPQGWASATLHKLSSLRQGSAWFPWTNYKLGKVRLGGYLSYPIIPRNANQH